MTGPSAERTEAWIDARNLAMARIIGAKICARPALLEDAKTALAGLRRGASPASDVLAEWDRIITQLPCREVVAALVEDSAEGRRLRRSSPFDDVLTPAERKAIAAEYERLRE